MEDSLCQGPMKFLAHQGLFEHGCCCTRLSRFLTSDIVVEFLFKKNVKFKKVENDGHELGCQTKRGLGSLFVQFYILLCILLIEILEFLLDLFRVLCCRSLRTYTLQQTLFFCIIKYFGQAVSDYPMTWVQFFFKLDPNYLCAADDILKFIGFRQMMNIILLTLYTTATLVTDRVPKTSRVLEVPCWAWIFKKKLPNFSHIWWFF